MTDFEQTLIKAYGTQIENDLQEIQDKFAMVIAAHLWAGTLGDNILCRLNRLFKEEGIKHSS